MIVEETMITHGYSVADKDQSCFINNYSKMNYVLGKKIVILPIGSWAFPPACVVYRLRSLMLGGKI